MTQKSLRMAIIGGGIAGTAVANALMVGEFVQTFMSKHRSLLK